MTSPPPCTHTPPAAPPLSPVISHFMPSTCQEVSKGSRNSAESGMWPTTWAPVGFFTTIAQVLWVLLSRVLITKWVGQAWDEVSAKDMIKHAFEKCGISVPIDGSGDRDFCSNRWKWRQGFLFQ